MARAESETNNAGMLRAQYDALKEQLQHNQFTRQLVLDSTEAPDRLKGSIYAVVDYPFGTVQAGLDNPDHWCDVLLLHINTKYCHAEKKSSDTILNVNIGKKTPEALADSTRIAFNYKVAAITPAYFKIMLNAKEGPMGTSDYHIALEAVTLENSRTFIHLTYSYATSMTGRLAMRTYLATAGSGKVGFTVIGRRADGKPDYINGVRGLIERNTMRYYLAIDAFLSTENIAPNVQLEKRLQTWFAATERYSRQLHEMDRSEYLEMKRAENMRQLSMLRS
ncbi:MAG TPA: hypothetical protein VIF82_12650 [Burkholderiaceae bacterium]